MDSPPHTAPSVFDGRFVVVGHRGAAAHAPENTLASIEAAAARGADAIEVDLRMCGSEIVVLHDDTLDRTTDGRGPLDAIGLDALRTLDAGEGQTIPLLDEVLEACAGRLAVDLELKGEGTGAPVARELQRTFERGPLSAEDVWLTSFRLPELHSARAVAPELPVGLLVGRDAPDAVAHAVALGAFALHPHFRSVDPPMIAAAREHSLLVVPYTVNDAALIERMRTLGCDGVITDYPERGVAART
jgi:glycerophosphoryl diester phosphodiesterase